MNRSRISRWSFLLMVLTALLLSASGCGSVQASSWTGLTLAGEEIYAADLQKIQALNAADGEPVQSFPANPDENFIGFFYVAPTIGDSYLIAATQSPARGFFSQAQNSVIKLDIETGAKLWSFDDAKGAYIEAGAVSGDIFVIGNSDSNVYALDVNSGELVWEKPFETGHRVWATPLIVDDTVYIGSMDHNLYALRLSDGKELWRFSAGGAFASTPALVDGTLYIGAFDNRVYAIDADDGTERWHFPTNGNGGNWFWGSPATDGDRVYAIDVKGNVYALDAESGEVIWHRALEAQVRAGPALSDNGGTLLISSVEGTLYALDTADGTRKWAAEGEGRGYVTPIVRGNTVYEARIHGTYRVRALELLEGGDGYKELWVYPLQTEE